MVQCATNWSIPPTVCINCYLNYVKLKKAEYDTMHLVGILLFLKFYFLRSSYFIRFIEVRLKTMKLNFIRNLLFFIFYLRKFRIFFKIKFFFQNNIFSLDNRTCTDVIYGGYLLSYSRDISDALNEQIWEQSRCSCKSFFLFVYNNSTSPLRILHFFFSHIISQKRLNSAKITF